MDPTQVTPEMMQRIAETHVEPDPPGDFDAFWQATVDELGRVPLNLEITPLPSPKGDDDVVCGVWRADSLGGRRIGGYLAMPRSGSGALWVYGHGYGNIESGSALRPDLARRGFIAVGVDARGYGLSREPGDPGVPGWITHGIDDIRGYILRGAVMDTVRAVQVARSLEGADAGKTVLSGVSFSGGLAVMAAPWIADLAYVAVGVPTFGAYDLRRTLVKGGSGAEINQLFERLDQDEAAALRHRLRYFDAVNFAARIQDVPVTVGFGVVDPVVPGETVAAIYHALSTADKEILGYPCAHYPHPLEAKWSEFDRHVLERAVRLTGIT